MLAEPQLHRCGIRSQSAHGAVWSHLLRKDGIPTPVENEICLEV